MLLFAVIGLGMEVVFTALCDINHDPKRHLMGYSSLWYCPLYALTPVFLSSTAAYIFPLPFVLRGMIYMLAIFLVEYFGMLALRKLLGTSPSEAHYYKARFNLHGLIRLDFAPAMFALGLILEGIFLRVS